MTTPLVLLVEDDWDVAQLTQRALACCDVPHVVHHAPDGAAALAYLNEAGNGEGGGAPRLLLPRLVLLDLALPLIDGLTVLRRIRAQRRTSWLPVVILSSCEHPSDLRRGYELGANAFVRKSGSWQDFQRAVRRTGAFWLGANEPPP